MSARVRATARGEMKRIDGPHRTRKTSPPAWSVVVLIGLLPPAALAGQATLRTPPPADGPVDVAVGLYVIDVVDIDEDEQTFVFQGRLSVRWTDPRLAFDPSSAGVDELVYQGSRFEEEFPAWWPMLVLRNLSGTSERHGLVVRVRPDGTVHYSEDLQASAEVKLALARVPFDRQRLPIIFDLLGFDDARVRLRPDPERSGIGETSLRQWHVGPIDTTTTEHRPSVTAGSGASGSQVGFTIPLDRDPGYLIGLTVLPIVLLVGLSWSVFWMERESLGERMDISFTGLLTVVAYQIVISDRLPRISDLTILSTFVWLSYLCVAATILVNLRVGALDRRGDRAAGDRLDVLCRWIFPIGYVASLGLTVAIFFSIG